MTGPVFGPEIDARLRAVAEDQPAFSGLIGSRLVSVERDKVVADLLVGQELGNRNGVLHGGAVMAFADNLGGTASAINLPEGASTTTIESKTNFFASVAVGETARGECTPLHRGRTTMVWQTRITRPDGKLAALVTQTQLVMTRR
jgi:1,4-dihydroxy-2-naphthoyl-CoA hydrolase